jgi:hypothetical protein
MRPVTSPRQSRTGWHPVNRVVGRSPSLLPRAIQPRVVCSASRGVSPRMPRCCARGMEAETSRTRPLEQETSVGPSPLPCRSARALVTASRPVATAPVTTEVLTSLPVMVLPSLQSLKVLLLPPSLVAAMANTSISNTRSMASEFSPSMRTCSEAAARSGLAKKYKSAISSALWATPEPQPVPTFTLKFASTMNTSTLLPG